MNRLADRVGSRHRPAAARPGESLPEPPGPAFCDVDHELGALVVTADAAREGLEVEIERVESPGSRTHVYVLRRLAGSEVTFAALFPSLPAGRYRLFAPDASPVAEAVVRAGRAVTVTWA